MNDNNEQLPEFVISDRCVRFLKWSIPCELALALFAVFHPFIQDRYDTLCIGVAIIILQGMAAMGTIMFNQPRQALVRGALCFPLGLGIILAVVLAAKQDVAQRMRDEIMYSTNDLAKRVDSLQRFSVRNAILSEEEERDFAVRICSALNSCGYTNSIVVCVSTNGDCFCSALSDELDSIFGWIPKHQVPIAISECENGDFSCALRMLQQPPLPRSEFENWRDDCREISFSNQSKLGMIGAVVLNYLSWLGVDADFRVDVRSKALRFTFKGENLHFALEEEDIDALIDEQTVYIISDVLPSVLARQGLLERLSVDSFVNMFGEASYSGSLENGIFQEVTRSQFQGIARETLVSYLESESRLRSDKMRDVWLHSLTNFPGLNSTK